jgi:mxaJ protein
MSFNARAIALSALFAAAAGLTATSASAAAPDGALRICASKIEQPYSEKDAKGFENKIAAAVADAMGRKAEFVWFDKPAIYLVRDGLDKNLCDVVFGVDAEDPRVLVTIPYFRTGYVYVTKADAPELAPSWKSVETTEVGKIAVRFSTPGELILKATGKYEENVSYGLSLVNFEDKRNRYTQVAADRLTTEVASGEAGASIAFASDVARYVKASSTPLKMTMIDDDFAPADGPKIPLHFDQAIGVRKDDTALKTALDAGIEKAKPAINKILADEGIPTLKPNS